MFARSEAMPVPARRIAGRIEPDLSAYWNAACCLSCSAECDKRIFKFSTKRAPNTYDPGRFGANLK
jgi:hypothetical protein